MTASAYDPLGDLPSAPLVVAAIQATPSPGDVAGNATLAARLVEQAAEAGAALAILPELFLSAYHPPTLLDSAVMAVIALSDDGSLAVAGRSGGGAGVWSLPSGSRRLAIESANPVTAIIGVEL